MLRRLNAHTSVLRHCQSWVLRRGDALKYQHSVRACFSSTASCGNASEPASEKPYYITTPIFYVNAAPHVGHLYSMVLADILKRYQLLKGRKALMLTGTDEHGMKIQQAAAKAGIDPKTFCTKGAEIFKSLAQKADVEADHFIRTTDEDHQEAVRYAWSVLQEKGYIYLSKHEGWYSVSDETYYPQSGVHLIVDPPTGRKIMVSVETGKEVEWTSETNYRFRLSAFKDRLLDFYKKNPNFVIPRARMNDVITQVSAGLEDLSVSRPSSRLTWGIRVPTDDSQTIYVWLDALVNYITKAGYPWTPGRESAGGWPADCQIIGKDIVRFHCIYWPAFLLALDIPPPRQILTHAHWTLGREKMAKSTGNVVNPFFAMDRFGVDAIRYYLAHDGGITQDADYGNEYIIERYKKGLQGGLGNLTSRIMRSKKWSVKRAVQRGGNGELGSMDGPMDVQRRLLSSAKGRFMEKMEALDVSGALKDVMGNIYATNAFLQHMSPWDMPSHTPTPSSSPTSSTFKISTTDAATQLHLDQTVYLCAETIRISAILLQPFMPSSMLRLLDMLSVEKGRRGIEFADFGKDEAYGEAGVDLGRGHLGTLFPPLATAV